MASATSEVRTVETVVRQDTNVTVLVLTKAEAETLRAIAARIGGEPSTTRRKHTDAIGKALYEAGVLHTSVKLQPGKQSIYFADEENI